MATDLSDVGRIYYRLGDVARAVQYLERAVDVVESLRVRAGAKRLQEQIFAAHQSAYQSLIAVLAERGQGADWERAFHLTERSRARRMVELLAEREIETHPETSGQQALVDEERRLRVVKCFGPTGRREFRPRPGMIGCPV
jgi:hypothetical protein